MSNARKTKSFREVWLKRFDRAQVIFSVLNSSEMKYYDEV